MKPKRLSSHFFLPSMFLAAVSSACAADGTWAQTTAGPFDWGDTANWTDGIIADGPDSTAFFTTDLTAGMTVSLETDRTIGNITFTDSVTSSNDLTISGNILTLDRTGATKPTINVTQAGRILNLSGVTAGGDGLLKTGPGTLRINGSAANTFTGGIVVNGGRLWLGFVQISPPVNLVNTGNALTLANGTLNMPGVTSTTNTEQTFAGTTLGAGTNAITLVKGGSTGIPIINLGDLTVSPSSVTFINPGTVWANNTPSTTEKVFISSYNGNALPTGSATADKRFVNAGLFYRNSVATPAPAGSARYISVDNNGQLQALPTTMAQISGGASGETAIQQLGNADATFTNTDSRNYALVINPNAANRFVTLADSGTYTINGILGIHLGNTAFINPGAGTSNIVIGPELEFKINLDNTGSVTINAPIANNGSTGGTGGTASGLTVSSSIPSGTPGTVTLAGANTYTGATTVGSATLALGADNVLPDTNVILGSGTLKTNTFDDTVGTLNVTGAATINMGAGSNVAFANSSAVAWTGSLNITGTLTNTSLRFGTSSSGLSPAQLAVLSVNGAGQGTYSLDANGYLIVATAGYATWATTNGITGELFGDDYDNDGISNGVEYALGTNPTTSSQPAGVFSGNTLTFTKGSDAITNADVSWIIETSTTLQAGSWTDEVTQAAGNSDPTISFTFTPGTPARKFARLKVSIAP